MVALSSMRGSYVLLDFWASWCAPCRKKNKELKARYEELSGMNLKIVSVSLDDDRDKWLRAVEEDGTGWLQLIDPDGFNESLVRKDYKFEAVPTVFLIGPDGIIVSTNPDIDTIMKLTGNKD